MSQSRFGGAIAITIAIIAEIPVLLFATVMAAAVMHGSLKASDTATWTAVVVFCLASVLVVWAVLYFGFLRKRTPRRPVLSFVLLTILPGIIMGGVYVAVQRQHSFDAWRAQEVLAQNEDDALADLAFTLKKVSLENGESYSVILRTKLPGEAGRIEKSAKALILAVSDAHRAFDNAREAADIDETMSAESLNAPGGLNKATQALIDVRAAIATREARIDAAYADCRKVLAAAKIDPAKQRAALTAFDRHTTADKASRASTTSLELDHFNEMMAIVGELKDAPNDWRLRHGGLEFDDMALLIRINRHWARVRELNKQLRTAVHK